MQEYLDKIRGEILAVCSEEQKEGASNFFKEGIIFLGAKVPDVRLIAKNFYKKNKSKLKYSDWLALFDRLWRRGTFEEGIFVLEIIPKLYKSWNEDTLKLFDEWLENYISNWAHCDDFATHTIAKFVKKDDMLIINLYSWTKSRSRWKRRAAAVSLTPFARKGLCKNHVLAICNRMMEDEDDMVQKGVGWLLKELSKNDKISVLDFLKSWEGRAPRLIVRIATEKIKKQG